jgi:hypothetical protein
MRSEVILRDDEHGFHGVHGIRCRYEADSDAGRRAQQRERARLELLGALTFRSRKYSRGASSIRVFSVVFQN